MHGRGYSNTVLVGPRLASPKAAESACAKLAFSSGLRKPAIDSRPPRETRNSRSMPNSSCTIAVEPHPERIERPFPHLAVLADLAHGEFGGRDRDLLVGARGAEIGAEGEVDQQHIEPEESRRPARRRSAGT